MLFLLFPQILQIFQIQQLNQDKEGGRRQVGTLQLLLLDRYGGDVELDIGNLGKGVVAQLGDGYERDVAYLDRVCQFYDGAGLAGQRQHDDQISAGQVFQHNRALTRAVDGIEPLVGRQEHAAHFVCDGILHHARAANIEVFRFVDQSKQLGVVGGADFINRLLVDGAGL